MVDFLFYLFSLTTLLAAGTVILTRNPINAAMLLILTFVGTGALFVLLGAYFLAAVQLAVYAGAVIVLFLFIIMLLDVDAARSRKLHYPGLIAGIGVGVLLVAGALVLFKRGEHFTLATLRESVLVGASTKSYGVELFTTYMLPVQMAGVLLLIAMLGVIHVSKRTKESAEEEASHRK